jgi:transposase
MVGQKAGHHAGITHEHAVSVFYSPSGDAVFLIRQTITLKFRIACGGVHSGALFLFRSVRGDYLEALYWDGSGLVLIAKRLEEGRFAWPPIVDERLSLTSAQLALLLEGIDWRRTHAPAAPKVPALA